MSTATTLSTVNYGQLQLTTLKYDQLRLSSVNYSQLQWTPVRYSQLQLATVNYGELQSAPLIGLKHGHTLSLEECMLALVSFAARVSLSVARCLWAPVMKQADHCVLI